LVAEAERRERSIGALVRTAVTKADDVKDAGANVAKIVHQGFKMTVRDKGGGTPAVGPPPSTSTSAQQPARPNLDPGDIVGNSVVAAVGVAVVSQKAVQRARKAFRRRRRGK
jgi:hypothetical protein